MAIICLTSGLYSVIVCLIIYRQEIERLEEQKKEKDVISGSFKFLLISEPLDHYLYFLLLTVLRKKLSTFPVSRKSLHAWLNKDAGEI